MGNPRWYKFTCSAATGSNEAHAIDGSMQRAYLIISSVTGFNSGAGNTRVNLIGKHSASDTYITVPGASALTEVESAFAYDLGILPPFETIKISLGTAPSGVATFYVGLLDL